MTSQLKQIGILSFSIHLIGLLFFLTFSNTTYAQSKTTFIKASSGIAFTNSGKKIRFRNVKETENSFVFTTPNRTKVELEKFKITQIDKRNGTKGLRYAAAAIGVTTLIVVNSSYIDEFYSLDFISFYGGDEVAIISIVFSIITGTIAGLIGLTQRRYKTIYTSPTFGRYEPKLNLKASSPNSIPSLTLSYSF